MNNRRRYRNEEINVIRSERAIVQPVRSSNEKEEKQSSDSVTEIMYEIKVIAMT